MRIRLELLAAVAALSGAAAVVLLTEHNVTAVGPVSRGDHSSLEALAPRGSAGEGPATLDPARARQRAQAIDAERLRLIARGELTAREATPAELRLIRSGAIADAAAVNR